MKEEKSNHEHERPERCQYPKSQDQKGNFRSTLGCNPGSHSYRRAVRSLTSKREWGSCLALINHRRGNIAPCTHFHTDRAQVFSYYPSNRFTRSVRGCDPCDVSCGLASDLYLETRSQWRDIALHRTTLVCVQHAGLLVVVLGG